MAALPFPHRLLQDNSKDCNAVAYEMKSFSPASIKPVALHDDSIHVCSLLSVHDVLAITGARYLVSIINEQLMPATPHKLDVDNHLKLACNDITQPIAGLVAPDVVHVERLIDFARHWNRQGPLVIHCWAGVSRSTAAALVTSCALNPDIAELTIAQKLRAASPSASPNRLLIQLADHALSRSGRMMQALEAIGTGQQMVVEGKHFRIPGKFRD